VGVGHKFVNGRATDEMCIRAYVTQKIPISSLRPDDVIPNKIDGINTDVIESAPAFILPPEDIAIDPQGVGASSSKTCTNMRRQQQRPVVAGISTGHYTITAGTISYFCKSEEEVTNQESQDAVFVLSNNHVFADVNNASQNDDLYQPGSIDGGTSSNQFANLTRWVPINLGGTTPNRVDAAIGRLTDSVQYRSEICSIGPVRNDTIAVEGMLVCKHGRTTGYTEGIVNDEAYDALVGMDHNNPSVVALFENQIRIEAKYPYQQIGMGGDSGSLVVTRENEGISAVGLYFAGPSNGTYGVANHIQDVLKELKIRLL
jgi:hypothetical protein